MHPVALSVPRGHLESDGRRQVQPEHHRPLGPVVQELHPSLTADCEGGPAQHVGDDGGVLRLLVERKQQRLRPDVLVPVVHRPLHRVIVDPDVAICIPGGGIEQYLGVLEPIRLAQARDGEVVDVEPRPMGPQAEPQDEAYDPQDQQKAEEDRAYELRDPGSQAILDHVDIVPGRVVTSDRRLFLVRLYRQRPITGMIHHFLLLLLLFHSPGSIRICARNIRAVASHYKPQGGGKEKGADTFEENFRQLLRGD